MPKQPAPRNMPAPAPRRFYSCEVRQAVALAQPGCRSVVLSVSNYDGERYDRRYPVLAVRTCVVDVYRAVNNEPTKGRTHKELLDNGWRFSEQEDRNELLIYSEDYGLVPVDFALGEYGSTAFKVVVCDWPSEEDEARFAPIVEVLWEEATKRAAMEKANETA